MSTTLLFRKEILQLLVDAFLLASDVVDLKILDSVIENTNLRELIPPRI